MAVSKRTTTRKLQLVTKATKQTAKGRNIPVNIGQHLTARQIRQIEAAAKLEGVEFSDFVRLSAIKAVKRLTEPIDLSDMVTLTRAQFEIAMEALNYAIFEAETGIESLTDHEDPTYMDVTSTVLEKALCRFKRLRYSLGPKAGLNFNICPSGQLFPKLEGGAA